MSRLRLPALLLLASAPLAVGLAGATAKATTILSLVKPTEARQEVERARAIGHERPVATRGLSGMRTEVRAAARPAKIENKAEIKVLTVTAGRSFPQLKALAPLSPTQVATSKMEQDRWSSASLAPTSRQETKLVKRFIAMNQSTNQATNQFGSFR